MAGVLESVRPLPFSSTDDGPLYFLPLIKAQTDAVLAGQLPRLLWELGGGWSPLESGQSGLLYPPYYLANLLARLLGRPLLLLELSAWLHIWASGLVAHALLPRSVDARERLGWSAALMLQPAPLLLGLNWHNYLAVYPWFLAAVLLLVQQRDREVPWSGGARLALVGLSGGLFVAAHPQMYLLAAAVLGVLWLAISPREAWAAGWRALAVAQLPLLVPVAYFKVASLQATADWMAGRGGADFVLHGAQALPTVLHGLLFGNLLGDGGFGLWSGVSGTGVGMFFNPLLFVALGLALLRRRWLLGALLLGLLMVMSIATFPWLRFGPLSALGLRWTWKVALFVGPVVVAALATEARAPAGRALGRAWGLAGLVALQLAVAAVGLTFDVWPGYRAAHPLGIERVTQETREALRRAGLPPGARVAVVGRHSISEPGLPLPVLGLMGNAPLLAGYETAHLYEPLERADAARAHLGLSTPWRGAIDVEVYRKEPGRWDAALRGIGVEALVSASAHALDPSRVRAIRDGLGGTTYVLALPGASAATYPQASDAAGARVRLERVGGGRLRSGEALDAPPQLTSPRSVSWEQLADGRWEGVPRVLGSGWWLAQLVALGWTALALRVRWPATAGARRDAAAEHPVPAA